MNEHSGQLYIVYRECEDTYYAGSPVAIVVAPSPAIDTAIRLHEQKGGDYYVAEIGRDNRGDINHYHDIFFTYDLEREDVAYG